MGTGPDDQEDLPFGAALRAQRLSSGLSLQALGNRVHYSRSHLSKVENGVKAATAELARDCDAALGCRGELVRRLPRPRPRGTPTSGAAEAILSGVDERALAPVRWPEHLPLDGFRATFDQLRRLAQVASPRSVIPALTGHGQSLVELAAATTRADVRDALYRLAARFVEHAGWMAQELGDNARAIAWTDWAAEIAARGGEDLTAFRFVRHGDVAMYERDGERTVELSTLALRHATDRRTKGLAAQRLAQGHAIVGDPDACFAALALSGELLTTAPGSDQPVLGSATVVDHHAMAHGWCLFDLAQPERAAEIMAVEVERLPVLALRARARYGARLARAHAARGDLDQACATARPVLRALPTLDSATIRIEVSALDATLRRHRRHPAVAQIMPLLCAARAHAASRPGPPSRNQ